MKTITNPSLYGASIYSDLKAKILGSFCEIQCPRASHVETSLNLPEETNRRIRKLDKPLGPNLWYVDFSPISDDTILGPFTCREDALRSEVEYLNKKIKESNHD